jgi:hypothetical protein
MTDDETTDYRLDPRNPRQLTPEEERRLAKTPIDYSDIPPLFGEDWLSAQLLDIVRRHCGTTGDELDSHGSPVLAELMTLCAEGFSIEITGEDDGHIFAKLRPEGRALLDQFRAERERDRALS